MRWIEWGQVKEHNWMACAFVSIHESSMLTKDLARFINTSIYLYQEFFHGQHDDWNAKLIQISISVVNLQSWDQVNKMGPCIWVIFLLSIVLLSCRIFLSITCGTEKGRNDTPEYPLIVRGKRYILFPSNRELLEPSGSRIMGKLKLGAIRSYHPAHHLREIELLRLNRDCFWN